MEQNNRGEEYDRIAERRKQNKRKKGYASKKPWWLVILIVLLLAVFLFYIKWQNSPAAREHHSFWAYLVEPRPTEVLSDSVAAPADDMAILFGADSATDVEGTFDDNGVEGSADSRTPTDDLLSETTNPALQNQPAVPDAFEVPVAAAQTTPPTTPQSTTFVINAGEFKSKGSAQFRVHELRQGNYAARIAEPDREGGTYKVIVGDYKNESTARSVANSMGFILEIRASVEEKR